jgi:hypothetical protein
MIMIQTEVNEVKMAGAQAEIWLIQRQPASAVSEI